MENTKESALKFFGSYLFSPAKCKYKFNPNGNSVDKYGKLVMSPSILADIQDGTFYFGDFYLELNPLSMISDEDAKQVVFRCPNIVSLGTIITGDTRQIGKELRK